MFGLIWQKLHHFDKDLTRLKVCKSLSLSFGRCFQIEDLSNGGTGCYRGQQTEVSQKAKQDQGKPVIKMMILFNQGKPVIIQDDDSKSIRRSCQRTRR